MAKDTGRAAEITPDLLQKRGRGRPPSGTALTTAQRQARYRAAKRASGICPSCGQPVPPDSKSLASAAPDLLDCAREAFKFFDEYYSPAFPKAKHDAIFAMLGAAIKKADGG